MDNKPTPEPLLDDAGNQPLTPTHRRRLFGTWSPGHQDGFRPEWADRRDQCADPGASEWVRKQDIPKGEDAETFLNAYRCVATWRGGVRKMNERNLLKPAQRPEVCDKTIVDEKVIFVADNPNDAEEKEGGKMSLEVCLMPGMKSLMIAFLLDLVLRVVALGLAYRLQLDLGFPPVFGVLFYVLVCGYRLMLEIVCLKYSVISFAQQTRKFVVLIFFDGFTLWFLSSILSSISYFFALGQNSFSMVETYMLPSNSTEEHILHDVLNKSVFAHFPEWLRPQLRTVAVLLIAFMHIGWFCAFLAHLPRKWKRTTEPKPGQRVASVPGYEGLGYWASWGEFRPKKQTKKIQGLTETDRLRMSYTSIFGEKVQPGPFFHMVGDACGIVTIQNQAFTYRRVGIHNEMRLTAYLEDKKVLEGGICDSVHGAKLRWTFCLIETLRLVRIMTFRMIFNGVLHFMFPLSFRTTMLAISWNTAFQQSFDDADSDHTHLLNYTEYERTKVDLPDAGERVWDVCVLFLSSMLTLLPITTDALRLLVLFFIKVDYITRLKEIGFLPEFRFPCPHLSPGLLPLLSKRKSWKFEDIPGVNPLSERVVLQWFTLFALSFFFYMGFFYQTISKIRALFVCPDYMWNLSPPWNWSSGCATVSYDLHNQ